MTATTVADTVAPAPSPDDESSLWEVAALGVDLRWRLADNRLKRRRKNTRRIVLFAAAAYAALNIIFLGAARWAPDLTAANTVVLLMSSMAMGWIFGPVLIGGVDETVDPTRLALLPLTPAERYVIQLSAALTGTGPMAAMVGLVVGLTMGHTVGFISAIVVPLAALTAVLFMVGAARSLAALLAIAQRSRVGRDIAVLLAALVAGVMFTLAQLARDVLSLTGSVIFDVLSWLPFAWPARAINAARAGSNVSAIAWLVASMALAYGAHWTWIRLSNHLLLTGERAAGTRRRPDRALLSGASNRFTAALSRQFIYLVRSPNGRVGLLFGIVFGVAFSIVQIVQQGEGSEAFAAFGILLAMIANLGATTNVLGFDAGSLWMEVLAGGPTRGDLVARELVALPNLLIPTWVAGLVVGFWTGEWKLVLLVSLLAVPVAFIVLTYGLLSSVVAPAPLPDWDNPFGNRQGNDSRGIRLVFMVLLGLVAVIIVSAPIFMVTFRSFGNWWFWFTPLIGLAYAATIFFGVAGWVGRYLRGKGPDFIEALAPRAVN